MKQAMFYENLDDGVVHCHLCPHECVLPAEGTGVCRARKNTGGELYSLNYARVASISLDPIEKKPLYHFHPGKKILSAGTFGCNFKCGYCQNWTIAHKDARTMLLEPAELADVAVDYVKDGNIGVAYTYNEPSIWYEFVLDTAILVKEKKLANVLVTNGFICREPLGKLLPYIDAMNIDVKAFTDEFYKKYCKGSLEAVQKTVEIAAASCHVEITTLVIPGLNDTPEEIGKLARWLSSISPEIVLHLSRFFPNYQMKDIPPTPVATLDAARISASSCLKYVYLGNI
jgi:pyruvate formate lyase activating enzyme